MRLSALRIGTGGLFGIAFLMWGNVVSAHGAGKTRSVEIGEVSSATSASSRSLGVLRDSADRELRGLHLSRRGRSDYVLSLSIVKIDTKRTNEARSKKIASTCVVSATLRRKRRGDIFAILQGSARAEQASSVDDAESRAVESAVHGALSRLPEAIDQGANR